MLPFLHYRIQLLQQLLARSNTVLVKYTQLDLDLAEALVEFLDAAIDVYRTLGEASSENELLALKAQFVTAESGTHPLTLERVTTYRRRMQRAIALLVLQQSAGKLRADIDAASQQLEGGRTHLLRVVLLAIEKRVIPPHEPGPVDQGQLEAIWRRLREEPATQLAARQLAMQLNGFDIQLLLADLLDEVSQPAQPELAHWLQVSRITEPATFEQRAR
jgi:hypothetical protein